VTGVVLLARTSKAAGRLSQQFREREVKKVYWAIVEGEIEPPSGQLVDFLHKDERHRKMHIAVAHTPDAQRAELMYRLLASDATSTGAGGNTPFPEWAPHSGVPGVSLVEVHPLTGRKHQIRVQLSHAGIPIVGDRKYGAARRFELGIALHSRRLVVEHPVTKMEIAFEAPPPASWRRFLTPRRRPE
jgi:23S rRNA pseudouridine1911/1915/1917 synthase